MTLEPPSEWRALADELAAVAQRDDRREIQTALSALRRAIVTYSEDTPPHWDAVAAAVTSNGIRTLKAATNALRRMPSPAAYGQLDQGAVSLLTAIPALHEIRLLSTGESVSAVVQASEALQLKIVSAEEAVTGQSERLSKLLSLAADDTLASSYAAQATAESKRADRWRIAAVSVLGVAVAFAAITVFRSLSLETDLQQIAGRLGLSAALAAFGTYLQHQAGLHRSREGEARHNELVLRTIGPYSASLPDDEASALRSRVAVSIFAGVALSQGEPGDVRKDEKA